MERLARHCQEHGLQRHIATVAQHRSRLNGARADRLNALTLRYRQSVASGGLPGMCLLYAVLNALAACVCLAEVCWDGLVKGLYLMLQ